MEHNVARTNIIPPAESVSDGPLVAYQEGQKYKLVSGKDLYLQAVEKRTPLLKIEIVTKP